MDIKDSFAYILQKNLKKKFAKSRKRYKFATDLQISNFHNMLIDFSVENFRSFKDRQTITFEPDNKVKGLEKYYIAEIPDREEGKKPMKLLKIGMIYGANASGKSNLLKALMFLGYEILKRKKDKDEKLDFEPFAFDDGMSSKNSYMEINLIANRTKYNYKLEFNKDAIIYEELNYYKYYTSKKAINIFKRTTNTEKQLPKIEFNKDLQIDDLDFRLLGKNTLWNETVLVGFNRTSIDIDHLLNLKKWFTEYLDNSIETQSGFVFARTLFDLVRNNINKKKLIGIIKSADLNIEDIEIETKTKGEKDDTQQKQLVAIRPKYSLHKVGESVYMLPFKEESDGTKRFFGLAGVLLKLIQSPTLAPIDELESSLHPDLYEAFILTFLKNAKESQLLFTTHNREFLRNRVLNKTANEAIKIFRNDAVWIADKREDASTELYSISDFDSSVVRNTTSVYNALVIGKLGGKPNVSNDLMF